MHFSRLSQSALCALVLMVGCGPAESGDASLDETSDVIPSYPGDDSGASDQVAEVSSAITVGPSKATALRCTADVNFRETPSVHGKKISVLREGTVVTRVTTDDDSNGTHAYFQVSHDGKVGWIYGPYLLDYKSKLLAWGLHHNASDALRKIGITSGRIMQTIGGAAASSGTHLRDGTDAGDPYSAAVDLSVSGMSSSEIRHLLSRLADVGFAGWYRNPGHDGWPASQVRHLHAVYTDCKMKSSLDAQIRDWLDGRNGLANHGHYSFYQWDHTQKATIRRNFEATN